MAEKKNVSFRPDTESAAVLDKIANKSAFINNAIHSYDSGRLPDMQKAAEVFCRIEKTAGQLVGSVDLSGLLELHTSRRRAADRIWHTYGYGQSAHPFCDEHGFVSRWETVCGKSRE